MRIIFMGTPSYATEIFKALLQNTNFKVVGLVAQPDRPAGRKKTLTPPDTKRYLLEVGIDLPLLQPEKMRDSGVAEWLQELRPDVMIVAAFGQILPQEILDIAPCYNLHASILPAYRGASPIQESLLHYDEWCGVSFMEMERGLDCGPMLGYRYVKSGDKGFVRLWDELSRAAADLTVACLQNLDQLRPLKQSGAGASYCRKIKKEDGLVQLDRSVSVMAKYRAYEFWPGIHLESGLKLKKVALHSASGNYRPGEVLKIENDHLLIGCQQGALKIFNVQAPSKQAVDALSYSRGKRLQSGDTLL